MDPVFAPLKHFLQKDIFIRHLSYCSESQLKFITAIKQLQQLSAALAHRLHMICLHGLQDDFLPAALFQLPEVQDADKAANKHGDDQRQRTVNAGFWLLSVWKRKKISTGQMLLLLPALLTMNAYFEVDA